MKNLIKYLNWYRSNLSRRADNNSHHRRPLIATTSFFREFILSENGSKFKRRSAASATKLLKKTANNKVVQVTLVRYRPSINYNLSSLEISKLAYKKLLIPQGGLEFVDDSVLFKVELVAV